MKNHLVPPLILHFIFTVFCFFIAIPSSYSDADPQYEECSRPSRCGPNVSDVRYPFWGENIRSKNCGRQEFELKCHQDIYPTIGFGSQMFRVLNINISSQTMMVRRDGVEVLASYCSGIYDETTLNYSLFNFSPNVRNLRLFYECGDDFSYSTEPNRYICPRDGQLKTIGFYTIDDEMELGLDNLSDNCKKVVKIPILFTDVVREFLTGGDLRRVLSHGFEVVYNADGQSCSRCEDSGGMCGSSNSEPFVCHCRGGPEELTCPKGNKLDTSRKIGIAIGAAVIGVTATCIIMCWTSSIMSKSLFRNITKNDRDIEAFIRDYGPLAPKRYSFSAVKKMTNSFKHKLGQGGYGDVYKGKLSDGRTVAVKLLNTSKGDGQEFINEVASISRTSHVNVVTLLGFCFDCRRRALIYEYMPNGSLEKFIYNEKNLEASQCIGWDKMYQIALGIARGLEYLHRGCNTRILHFDIKPHNILLDEDFCPKISDFGLAKLCLKKESIVSMLEARGTIGYIAPEVFSRSFGEVSHKSDVYSYGMMVLEMVGGKNNLNAGVAHSSEIYFPHWIYKQVEQGKEFKWHGVSSVEENEIVKKMIIAGLWCIQTRPSDRPSMSKVIDMLQGGIEALSIPTMPFPSSPPRLPKYSSTASMSGQNS